MRLICRHWFRGCLKPVKAALTAPLRAKPEPPAWTKTLSPPTKRAAPSLERIVSLTLARAAAEQANHDTFSYYHAQPGQKGELNAF